jgi:hypothetical protein
MSAEDYCRQLLALCEENLQGRAPYVVRTRFERLLFGIVASYSQVTFGRNPNGITTGHITKFILTNELSESNKTRVLRSAAQIFEKFTYLCDTSNWSNDGQDPRVEMCRGDIIGLCEDVLHFS